MCITGKVVRIMNFGAFVELAPGKDGMIHISKLANHRVEKVEDVVNIGDELEVKVNEIDAQGRINLIRNDITYPSHEGGQRPFSGERRRPRAATAAPPAAATAPDFPRHDRRRAPRRGTRAAVFQQGKERSRCLIS